MDKRILPVCLTLLVYGCREPRMAGPSIKDDTAVSMPEGHPDTSVALAFINGYVENANRESEAMKIVAWTNQSPYVTASFKSGLARMVAEAFEADPESGLGFDPVFDAQDYPEEGFEMANGDNATGYVTVVGKAWKDFKLRLKLVKHEGQWLVDGAGAVNIPQAQRAAR